MVATQTTVGTVLAPGPLLHQKRHTNNLITNSNRKGAVLNYRLIRSKKFVDAKKGIRSTPGFLNQEKLFAESGKNEAPVI